MEVQASVVKDYNREWDRKGRKKGCLNRKLIDIQQTGVEVHY
jgi:hypothetical protein